MQDASEQRSKSRIPVGYRPFISAELSRISCNPVYAYVTAAAGLGLVLFVAVAFTAGRGHLAAAPQVSDSLSLRASGLLSLPAAYTGPAPFLLAQAEPQKIAGHASPLLPQADTKSAEKPSSDKNQGNHKHWSWFKGSGKNRTAKRRPYVSPNPPAEPDAPTAQQLAAAAANAGPFVLAIQGEVTVAGYDAGTGIVETYEGQIFKLDKTAGETSEIRWPEYPFNVHYRCDETGSCTLNHGGASASAKRTR